VVVNLWLISYRQRTGYVANKEEKPGTPYKASHQSTQHPPPPIMYGAIDPGRIDTVFPAASFSSPPTITRAESGGSSRGVNHVPPIAAPQTTIVDSGRRSGYPKGIDDSQSGDLFIDPRQAKKLVKD
jgi:hypothetical protein